MSEPFGPLVLHGDCVKVMVTMPDNCVDAIVTDPPYDLTSGKKGGTGVASINLDSPYGRSRISTGNGPGGFMGKSWDATGIAFDPNTWRECLRVLKPGGHLLSFGGTRTSHRLACAIEDAGFEIRDSIAWLYGSGFPKSRDISKDMDKAAGAEREVTGSVVRTGSVGGGVTVHQEGGHRTGVSLITAPATDDARKWEGWGTAMKPGHEILIHGTKPAGQDAVVSEIGSQLDRLEGEWSSIAKPAEQKSTPIPRDEHEGTTDSVPENAATLRGGEGVKVIRTGAVAASSDQTDTSASASTGAMFWSTVTSWRRCWAELSEPMSMSTTETTTAPTTDLTILLSSISSLTATSMLQSETNPVGLTQLATAVDSLFGGAVLNWRATHALFAIENATSSTLTAHQVDHEQRRSAHEPIIMARKPFDGTVATNVLTWGTGAINVDQCRIGTDERTYSTDSGMNARRFKHGARPADYGRGRNETATVQGRWPANVILDESMAAVLDEQSGTTSSKASVGRQTAKIGTVTLGDFAGNLDNPAGHDDTGGASRFFLVVPNEAPFKYQAKAPAKERPSYVTDDGRKIAHPTTKPLELMRWLVRLVTPPGGTILDPFAGSGTTLEAAVLEEFGCIGIEAEADYLPLIQLRLDRSMMP